MIVSEARIAANRANSLKSTGPTSASGKERSRCNAVKHGLTGDGVAISSEEVEAIDRRFAGLDAQFRPRTEGGRNLIRRAAMLSVRIERAAIQEAATISMNVRSAGSDFDEARETEVDRLFEALAENPATAVRRLVRMPEGVDRILDTWADLREDLTIGDGSRWTAEHGETAVLLTGRKIGGFGLTRFEALASAVAGDFSLLRPADGGGLDAKGRRDWAREALAGLIDEATEQLTAHRARLDHETLAADRAGAPARALFDPSKSATLARKYEAAAERAMYRAIREMEAIEAEAVATGRVENLPPLASFSTPAPARVVPPPSMPAEGPPNARFGADEGSTDVPIAIGRAEKPRF